MCFPIWESDSRIVRFSCAGNNEFVDRPKHSSVRKAILGCDAAVSTHIKGLANGFGECGLTKFVTEVGFECGAKS
jgi:hypothetical protein